MRIAMRTRGSSLSSPDVASAASARSSRPCRRNTP